MTLLRKQRLWHLEMAEGGNVAGLVKCLHSILGVLGSIPTYIPGTLTLKKWRRGLGGSVVQGHPQLREFEVGVKKSHR